MARRDGARLRRVLVLDERVPVFPVVRFADELFLDADLDPGLDPDFAILPFAAWGFDAAGALGVPVCAATSETGGCATSAAKNRLLNSARRDRYFIGPL
jgi:hypothetical protein